MTAIPVTSSMCLGRGPGTPVPKDRALADLLEQKVYLEGEPDVLDLARHWLPWSWATAYPDQRALVTKTLSQDAIRSMCVQVRDELERQVRARESCCVPEWPCAKCRNGTTGGEG